jgi:hypothetical protein
MLLKLKTTNVPIVNYAWDCSFKIQVNNQKAILERGWFPTNRALEVSKDVLSTKATSDERNLLCLLNSTSLSSIITCNYNLINPNVGAAAMLLEAAINNRNNDPTAMKRRQERNELANKIKFLKKQRDNLLQCCL